MTRGRWSAPSAIVRRVATPRWDGDERGEGAADATPFAAGAVELVQAMQLAMWVAEQPEVHLLPHLELACRSLPLRFEEARSAVDGAFDVSLRWTGETASVGEIRAAVFALVGSFAELSTYVKQRRIEETEDGDRTFLFEIVTGFVDGESRFAPHGHSVRVHVSALA
jgi:hypothetical protein